MNQVQKLVDDDENGTVLFKRWEDHVLKNYPNPERIGCPDHEVLRTFVETPSKVGLSELHGNHITQCAECTRDLIELRSLREDHLSQAAPVPGPGNWWSWRKAFALTSLCLILAVAGVVWRYQGKESKRSIQDDQVAKVNLDLSADDITRGSEGATTDKPISFPRRLIELHLTLPYYSPAGEYQVTIVRERNSAPLDSERVRATGQNARTELWVRLDLREMTAGRYYLGTKYDGEPTTYFYTITIG